MPILDFTPSDSVSVYPEDRRRLFRRKAKLGKAVSKASSRGEKVAEEHGASDKFLNSGSTEPFTVPGTSLSFMAYASGGGKRSVLDSNSTFSGREAGGASRAEVYGTSHFGSGYPYGNYGSFVSSRPFPFFFVPVPVSRGFLGGDEYLDMDDDKRPGGTFVTALVQPSYDQNSVTFRLVGDNSSVTRVFDALAANCSIANLSSATTAFSPSPTTWPLPEQIVQYYRASSFALSLDGYNNTATLLVNAPASNDSLLSQIPDTPLPSGLNMTLLECINSTIGASVPLADVESGKGLSSKAIAGIAIGAGGGVAVLIVGALGSKHRQVTLANIRIKLAFRHSKFDRVYRDTAFILSCWLLYSGIETERLSSQGLTTNVCKASTASMMLTSKSSPSESSSVFTDEHNQYNHFFRRKGGGGKGGSSGKGGKSSSKGGSSASSIAKKQGASDAFVNSRGSKSFTVTGSGSSGYPYSSGGGKRIKLPSSSFFNGREAGGGDRNTIYGTSHFGSGYPYGGYGYYVDNRPFPYYFYPVPCSHNYYGGDEYLNATDRPGGNLVTALVNPSYNTSSVTYRLVGDDSSVVAVFDALVANCSVANSSSVFSTFTPSNSVWPLPEQVVQYYRASSFALSLDGYNNTVALPANAPASNNSKPVEMADTPLPSGLNMTFLSCVNYTVGASVPLVETPKKGLSSGQIATIVGASIAGLFLLITTFCCLRGCLKRSRKDKKKKKILQNLDDPVPKIEVVDPSDPKSPPPYTQGFAKDVFDKEAGPKSRPESVDERTLVADSSGRKERWSYASSSASSRSDVSDSIENHTSKNVQDRQAMTNIPDAGSKDTSWLSKIPFPGRFGYRSVKHQSTSSVELPLTDTRHSHELEADRGRGEGTFLSPSHSPFTSRSPSPSPTTPRFPLMHGEEKR
ncbi:hypothetical protein ACEPAF_4479 [Sanghuangporus sanghuang]